MKPVLPLLAIASLLATLPHPAAALAPHSPALPFAMISPATAANLHNQSGPAVENILASADFDLHQTPHPLPRVHLEGTLPSDPWYPESHTASLDYRRMLDLALAFRLSGNRRYLDVEERYFTAWLNVYHLSFNPIDESTMDQILFAYDLTESSLSPPLRERMLGFFRDMANGYIQRIAAEKTEDIYNWQSHRIKLIVLSSYATGDPALMATALRLFRHHLQGNLLPGSVVIDFGKRDALHYVVYDLEPLTVAALAAKAHGTDLFNFRTANGSSLRAAIQWLQPYTLGEKQHIEFAHTNVHFDIARANAGLKGYSGKWDPAQSQMLYALALNLSPDFLPLYRHVRKLTDSERDDWLILLKDATR